MRTLTTATLILLLALAIGCEDSPTEPTRSALSIRAVSPAEETTITLSQYPYFEFGGLVIPPGSGLISATVDMSVADDVPWAQLSVYLLTGGTNDTYCGQNTPDAPTWQFLEPGWETRFTVTGFRVVLPCDVTGIRAILHMRNNGNLMPPTASEIVAESTATARIHLRR
jgi:hypothetical protein